VIHQPNIQVKKLQFFAPKSNTALEMYTKHKVQGDIDILQAEDTNYLSLRISTQPIHPEELPN
jgi:hypothetical protein